MILVLPEANADTSHEAHLLTIRASVGEIYCAEVLVVTLHHSHISYLILFNVFLLAFVCSLFIHILDFIWPWSDSYLFILLSCSHCYVILLA